MFIAVGRDEARSLSDDGRQWSKPEVGTELLMLKAVVFGNGKFVAVGSKGKDDYFQWSTDGKRWGQQHMDTGYGGRFHSVSFGNNTFIAWGGKGSPGSVFLSYSEDGEKWTPETEFAGKFRIRRGAYGNDVWVGVGDYGRIVVSSGNLKQWDDVPDTRPIDTMIDVTFGNGLFVGVGLHGLRRWSADGKKWSEPERGKEGEHLNNVVWTGNSFIAVGAGATYASMDGKAWQRRDNTNAPTYFTYEDGTFAGIAWKGRVLYSQDSIAWEEVFKSDLDFQGITAGRAG